MISAKEAYNLSAPNLDKYRAFIDECIRNATAAGKLKIEIREDPYNVWMYDESRLSKKDACAAKVIKELRNLGYTVSLYYSEGSQFVDMALVISWEK